MKFVIDDESHAEWCGEYDSYNDAFDELLSRSKVKWGEPPNVCPCTSWKTCGRAYSIIEYDDTVTPWKEISNKTIFSISSKGIEWDVNFNK